MNNNLTLVQLVELANSTGSLENISELILKLYIQNDENALDLVLKLAMSDYEGVTYKEFYQNIAVLGVLQWGIHGLTKLGKKVIDNGGYRPVNNVTRLLSHISSKSLEDFQFSKLDVVNVKYLNLSSDLYKSDEWTFAAKEILIDVVKSCEKEDVFPISIVQNLSFLLNENAQEHIFAALIARWFNFDNFGLEKYLEFVQSIGKPEIEYQNILKNNPYILEPFHAQIWSKPRFGEELVPDFLIRSMDNSYTVVEIEKPDFSILTKAGELSSRSVHAKRQVLDFRDWAINNKMYASQKFKEIYRPYCLVVIGRESELNEMQVQRLKQENESTQGVLKIVGFDWLYNRAKSTFNNLIKYGFERETFKRTIDEE